MNNSTHIVSEQSYSPFANTPTWNAAEFRDDAYVHYDRPDYDTV